MASINDWNEASPTHVASPHTSGNLPQPGLSGWAAVLVQWARHGENVANLTRTLSYRSFDGDLTARGRTQAHDLGRRLAGQGGPPPGLLACSPTRRARQTAEIVGRCLGLAVKCEIDELRELNVGSLDGRSDEEAWATYDSVLDGVAKGAARPAVPRWRRLLRAVPASRAGFASRGFH